MEGKKSMHKGPERDLEIFFFHEVGKQSEYKRPTIIFVN